MSSRSGDPTKKAQKYQNTRAFTHNKGSKLTKKILALPVSYLFCTRCKDIIDWRKQYRKYKSLTNPKKCVSCEGRKIKEAYHVICTDCAREHQKCVKCMQPRLPRPEENTENENELEDPKQGCAENEKEETSTSDSVPDFINAEDEAKAERSLHQKLEIALRLIAERRKRTIKRKLETGQITVRDALKLASKFQQERDERRGDVWSSATESDDGDSTCDSVEEDEDGLVEETLLMQSNALKI